MNDVSLIALLAFASLLPFLVAAGTCCNPKALRTMTKTMENLM